MRKFKRIASAVAALALAATMAVPMSAMLTASAGQTATITISDTEKDHKYTAYQIFAAEIKEGELWGIEWGNGVETTGIYAGLKALGIKDTDQKNVFAKGDGNDQELTTPLEVAEALNKVASNTAGITSTDINKIAQFFKSVKKTAAGSTTYDETNGYKISIDAGEGNEADGYYLIVDEAASSEGLGNGEALSQFLLKVISGTGAAAPKKNAPSFEKKVRDSADSTAAAHTDIDATGWVDSADHDMNDKVQFRLDATLPANYAAYTTYYELIFHDSLDADVFSAPSNFKVWVDLDDDGEIDAGEEITSFTAPANNTFDLKIANLKTLVPSAKAGDHVYVVYEATLTTSANLGKTGNWNAANLEYSNNPNYTGTGTGPDDNGEEDEHSQTREDKVVVFTYKTVVNKVDEDGKPLEGATFTLYKKYTEAQADGVNGKASGGELADVEIADGDYWYKVTTTSATGATFEFTGLDDGEYILVETQAPAGYTPIDPKKFTISATHTEGDLPALTELTASGDGLTFTAILDDGSVDSEKVNNLKGYETTIENKKGTRLPETGGIGTTLFYVIGGTLVVGAGVTLITKKRMQKD